MTMQFNFAPDAPAWFRRWNQKVLFPGSAPSQNMSELKCLRLPELDNLHRTLTDEPNPWRPQSYFFSPQWRWDFFWFLSERDDRTRLDAASSIVGLFRRPVHPWRWPWVLRELVQLAHNRGVDASTVLSERAASALFSSVDRIKVLDPTDGRFLKRVLAILNRYITEDLLGQDWRNSHRYEAFDEQNGAATPIYANTRTAAERVETELAIAVAIKKAELSPREAEVVAAVKMGKSFVELAPKMNISSSTARVLFHRASQKMKKTATDV